VAGFAECGLHSPGWPELHGWAAIGESWREIFRNQGPLRVWPSHVELRLYGLCWLPHSSARLLASTGIG
jgi:hypothetical protein